MLKGINQWCYPHGTPLEDVFSISKEAGFDAVELNVYEPGNIGLTLETTKEEAFAIKKMADEYGLALRSLSTSLLWGNSIGSPDPAVREKGKAVIRKMLELANIMEINTILVVPGTVTDAISYDVCYENSLASLKEVAIDAERFGVKIGIENVWNRFLLSPLEMAQYIDACESDFIGAYFDVGNILQFGYPEQWIRILNKRIFKVHVKDFNLRNQAFVPLLAGDVDWKKVKEALDEIGYEDTLTAELSPYKIDRKSLAFDTARHLDVILNG